MVTYVALSTRIDGPLGGREPGRMPIVSIRRKGVRTLGAHLVFPTADVSGENPGTTEQFIQHNRRGPTPITMNKILSRALRKAALKERNPSVDVRRSPAR